MMITTRIEVPEALAQYARGKYHDDEAGAVRFPDSSDIYVLLYDLLSLRPENAKPVDAGNLTIALPDRRDGRAAGGKDPRRYNWLSGRASKVLADRLRVLMWAELHAFLDEQKHLRGINYIDSICIFRHRYGIEALSEEAMFKHYQRWKCRERRSAKRGYRLKARS